MSHLRDELRRMRNTTQTWQTNLHQPNKPLGKLDKKLHIHKGLQAAPAAAPPLKREDYTTIAHRVFKLRMRYYYRLSLGVSLALLLLISVVYRGNPFMFPVKLLVLWYSFTLVKLGRDKTNTVETSIRQHSISALFTKKFFVVLLTFGAAIFVVFGLVYAESGDYLSVMIPSQTKTVKPYINDTYMFYWFFAFLTAFTYSCQFVGCEKNLLRFRVGTYRQDPAEKLQKIHWKSLAQEAATITVCVTLLSVPLYSLLRGFLFKVCFAPTVIAAGLNSRLPSHFFGIFSVLFLATLLTFITSFSLELLNRIYNIYAMTGCLVVNKPLSDYSASPFDTLLNGVTDFKEPFVRLTAFQELVFRATTTEVAPHALFFDRNNWALLFDQLSKVLRSASKAAKMDLPKKVEPAKKLIKPEDAADAAAAAAERKPAAAPKAVIFGRGPAPNALDDDEKAAAAAAAAGATSAATSAAGAPPQASTTTFQRANPESLFLKPTNAKDKLSNDKAAFKGALERTEDAAFKYLRDVEDKVTVEVSKFLQGKLDNCAAWQKTKTTIQHRVDFGAYTVYSYKLEADRRIPNKVVVGNAVVTISEMLLHAKSEDTKNAVLPTLTEALNTLARLYRSTTEFIQNPPVKPKNSKEAQHNAIKEINDLSISYFFKLVVFYNSTLNDLVLNPDTFKLAKWCTDVALEEQRQQQMETLW